MVGLTVIFRMSHYSMCAERSVPEMMTPNSKWRLHTLFQPLDHYNYFKYYINRLKNTLSVQQKWPINCFILQNGSRTTASLFC